MRSVAATTSRAALLVVAGVVACSVVACGGNVARPAGEGDRADAGRDASDSSGSDGSAADGGVGVVYPTEPVPSFFTSYPTTCFASELGLLETRLAPPWGRSAFGTAVLLDGDRLVAGAGGDGAEVFRRDDSTFRVDTFVAVPEPAGDDMGMAISGELLVFGSRQSTASGKQAGAAYVYRLGADAGALERVLLPDTPDDGLGFGSALAVDGETIAVASSKDVVVFDRSDGTWPEVARLVPDTPAETRGLAVALHGDLLAVAAYWFPSDSEGSAVFLYRRTAEGAFEPSARLDPDTATDSFGATPVLGDGLIVAGNVTPTVFADVDGGWAVEAHLAGPVSGTPALDGARLAVGAVGGVGMFERRGGAWPMTELITAHDVAATGFGGGAVAVHGDVLAVGAPGSQGDGAGTGAIYTYVGATAASSPSCADSTKGPAPIPGAGTGCVDPGSGLAKCPFAAPGTSTVAGITPYGAIAPSFAWLDLVRGFTSSTTLELSSVGPRRQGTSPSLSVIFDGVEGPPVGQPIPASFQLHLCTGSVPVDGVVTLEPPALDGSTNSSSLVGSLTIEHDGWSVKGTFHTEAPCTVFTDH